MLLDTLVYYTLLLIRARYILAVMIEECLQGVQREQRVLNAFWGNKRRENITVVLPPPRPVCEFTEDGLLSGIK